MQQRARLQVNTTMNATVLHRCNQCWKKLPATAFRKRKHRRPGQTLRGLHECESCLDRRKDGVQVGRHPDLDVPGPIRIAWHPRSQVDKLGGLPASSSSGHTCPDACSLKGRGCYAEYGIGGKWWRALSSGTTPPRGGPIGITWGAFLDKVSQLPPGQMWRHNLAGDLPGDGDRIAGSKLRELVAANDGRRGFTFTHKPLTTTARHAVRIANERGFTVNLSADSPRHADKLADLNVGPVVTVLAHDAPHRLTTPAGRRVLVCPAQRADRATCATCGWCARPRDWIVGFRAHGQAKRAVSLRVLS